MTVGVVASSVFIFVAQNWIVETFESEINLILIAIILISSTCFYTLLRSAIIASLKTQMLPLALGISTLAKISVALVLIYFGTGAFGIIVGFASFDIIASIFLATNLLRIIKSQNRSTLRIFESMKSIFHASTVSWVPALITSFGMHLGTIVIFSSQGASEAGVYFIAFSITTAIIALMMAPLGIAFPKLSGMEDGRKRFAWGISKISLVVFLPLTSSIIFYSEEILLLFGKTYAQGSFTFEILLISLLPLLLLNGIRSLSYAYGNYTQVLVIGISLSIPRIVLYFILVPIMGGAGAGISFTVGSILGCICSLVIARKIGLKIFWKDIALILIIPVGLSWVLSYFLIDFFIGIPISILMSYILFLKMGIITKIELENSLEVLPKKMGKPTLNFLNKVAKKLNNNW